MGGQSPPLCLGQRPAQRRQRLADVGLPYPSQGPDCSPRGARPQGKHPAWRVLDRHLRLADLQPFVSVPTSRSLCENHGVVSDILHLQRPYRVELDQSCHALIAIGRRGATAQKGGGPMQAYEIDRSRSNAP